MDETETGRAMFVVDERMLEQLLSLPPDIRLRGIYWSAEWRAFIFHIEGERLPHTSHGAMPTHLHTWERSYLTSPDTTRTVYDVLLDGEPIAHFGVEKDISDEEESPAWTR